MKTKLKSILAVALCAVGLSAFAADPLGSKDNPWNIGKPTASDVEAWTNGMGRLDIDGTGAMTDFSAPSPAPWADGSVTEAVVGSNVTAIGASAFKSCPALKTLVLNEQTPPTLGDGNDFTGVKIFVPAGKAGNYRTSGDWAAYADAIEEMRSVKGKELTKHLYEMTYSWWDAVKANDIGEMLAEIMAKPEQEEDDDLFFPYQVFDWYRQVLKKQSVLCTSCRNGNFVGRNFDWGYDDVDECVMHIPAAEGRLASVGIVSWFFPEDLQKLFDVDSFLPELTMDGINEKGVAINVNVVPGGDNGWTTNTNPKATKRLNAGFAVRTVLDNATNAAHAVKILQSHDIYSLKPLEFHWMISDATESYIVECAKSKLVVMRAHEARPKMSNYYVSHSPSRGEYDVLTNADLTATAHTPHAMGIERYANVSNGLEEVESVEEMYTHMTNVWYKPKFLPGNERKYWSDMNGAPIPDEFGQSTGERFAFNDGYDTARSNAFKQIQANYVAVTNYEAQNEGSRTIDHDKCPWLTNEVVHTVHTSIYDIEKRMLRVVVQEDAAYSFDAYLTPPKQEISAESDEFTVDLRPRIEFEAGKTRIDVVTWSATAWGAVPGSTHTDLGFTNKTTGATGVIAEGLEGENLDDCPLPEKDGEYLLTHSTGDLKSFVTFVVSGYPIGTPTNPWLVGPDGSRDSTVAWKDGEDAIVYLKPPRSAVSRAGLETLTNAMGGVNFAIGLVSADGTATNDVRMIIGASGKQYTSLDDMLKSDEESFTLYDIMGVYVGYNAMGGVHENGREIVTNFCAVAYELPDVTRDGYTFAGWHESWTNGAAVVTNGQDVLTFEPHALYAQWTANAPTPKAGELDVPDIRNGQPVTSIDAKQYVNDTSLKNVTTPLYLKSIGQRAFMGCTSLEKLTITAARSYDDLSPVPVTVGQNAFSGCSSLDTVYIAAEIDDLGVSAFQNCAMLKKIVFRGDGTIAYGASAFYRCGYQNGTGALKVYMSSAFQANNAALIADFKRWNTQVQIIEKVDVMPVDGVAVSISDLNLANLAENDRSLAVLVKTSVPGTPDPDDVDVEYSTDLSSWSALPAEKEANPDGTVLIEVTVPEGSSGFFRAVVRE